MKKTKRQLSSFIAMILFASTMTIPSAQTVLAASDTQGHWAESTINKWTSSGYISGYPDGTFRPNNAISRAEFVTLANKAFGYNTQASISFSDVQPQYWAYAEIQKGVAAGYIKGDSIGTFRPGAAVTRQEAAVMMAQIKKLQTDANASTGYTDYNAIANWAKPYVGAVSNAKVMQGFPNGAFRPQTSMTRAEAVTALENAIFAPVNNNTNNSSNNNNTTNNNSTNNSTNINNSTNNNNNNTTNNNTANYTLEDTSLRGRTINGDLIISSSLNSKDVTLNNVIVKGTVKVQGGGTIKAQNCDFNKVELDKSNVVFRAESKTKVRNLEFLNKAKIEGTGYENVVVKDDDVSEATIDAEVNYVELDTDANLKLYKNADISTLEVTSDAKNGEVTFTSGSEVDNMTIRGKIRIYGKGDINDMTVYVSGIRSSIKPDKLTTRGDGEKPSYTSGSSGSSSSSGSQYDDLTIDREDKNFDADGEKYHNVSIEADGVEFSDAIVYNRLTITRDVEDGEVILDDVTVRGDVYVYGGGKNSVIFRDCDIQGDIISDKDTDSRYGDEPVALEFEDDTEIDGDITVRGNTIIRAENGIKLNDVTVQRTLDEDLIIDARMQTLEVNSDCDVRITSKARIDNVNVASSRNVVFRMEGSSYIGTLDSRSDVVLRGNGTVKTIRTDKNVTKDSGIVNDDQTSTFVAVTGISGIPTTGVTGQSLTLSPVVSPSTASYKTVKWTITSNGAGANISGDRVLTATKDGTVTLLATIDNGKASGTAYTQSFTITFSSNVTPPTTTASKVTDITNANASNQYSVAKGGFIVLTANVDNKVLNDNEKVIWTVADADKEYVDIEVDATYSQIVKITALKADTSDKNIVVTAKVDNGDTGKTRNITILKQGTAPAESTLTSITANSTSVAQGSSTTLTAVGDNLSGKTINWTISGNSNKTATTITSATGNTATLQIASDETTGIEKITVMAQVDGGGTGKEAKKKFTVTESGSTNPDATPAANSITLNGVTANAADGTNSNTEITTSVTMPSEKAITLGEPYQLNGSTDPNGKTINWGTLSENDEFLQVTVPKNATSITVPVKDRTKQVTLPKNINVRAAVNGSTQNNTKNFIADFTIPVVAPEAPTADHIVLVDRSNNAEITSSIILNGGAYKELKAFLNPVFDGKKVKLESNNTNVVTVVSTGGDDWKLTGSPAGGTATLTATVINSNNSAIAGAATKTWNVTVNVEKKITSITTTPDNTQSLPFTKETDGNPTTFTLKANCNTALGDNKIRWSASPEGYIDIPAPTAGSYDQEITATILKADINNPREVTITAKMTPSGNANNIISSLVKKVYIAADTAGKVESIQCNTQGSAMQPGGTYTMTAEGQNLYGKTITWEIVRDQTTSNYGTTIVADSKDNRKATLKIATNEAINSQITVKAYVSGTNEDPNVATKQFIMGTDKTGIASIQITGNDGADIANAQNSNTFTATATLEDENKFSECTIDWAFKENVADTVAKIEKNNDDYGKTATITIGDNAQSTSVQELTLQATVMRLNNPVSNVKVADQKIVIAATTQRAAARRAIVQQPAQNVIQQTAQKPYIKDITLPTQQCEAGKDFDLSQAKVETVGENNFVVNWYLMRGFAEIPDSHTVRMDRAGTVTMQAYVEGGAQDGTAYTKDFVITFTEPQQPSEQEQQKLLEEQQKQQEQQQTQFTPVTPIQPEQPVTTPVTPVVPAVTTPVTTVTPAVPVTTPAQPEDTSIIISYMGSVVTNSDIILYAKKADGTDFQNAVWSIANDGGTLSTIEKNVLRATNKGNVIVKVTISNGTGLPKIRTKLITIV